MTEVFAVDPIARSFQRTLLVDGVDRGRDGSHPRRE